MKKKVKAKKPAPKKAAKALLQKKAFKRADAKSPKKTGDNKAKEQTVPLGRTIKTKDEYLPIVKKRSKELKDERWVAVIDKNTNEELAIVRLTTKKQPKTTFLRKTKKQGNKVETRFKHFVETEDNEGNAIRVDGKRFIENLQKYDLTANEITKVRDKVLHHSKQSSENRKKIEKLKAKDKKNPRD